MPSESALAARLIEDVPDRRVPAHTAVAIAVDTLVEGVHFLAGTPLDDVGFKAAAVNLSDLAAMGAEPLAAHVAGTLPRPGIADVDSLAAGLRAALAPAHAPIRSATIGTGPLAITVQVHGLARAGEALTRAGARAGETICVTGTLGDAGLGLAALTGERALTGEARAFAVRRHLRPPPRLAAGRALRGVASAAIDLSDGLASDLGHVLRASGGLGARIEVDRLPLSEAMRSSVPAQEAWRLALGAGDDYELLFTVPTGRDPVDLDGLRVTPVGVVTPDPGLYVHRTDGERFDAEGGYEHFGGRRVSPSPHAREPSRDGGR